MIFRIVLRFTATTFCHHILWWSFKCIMFQWSWRSFRSAEVFLITFTNFSCKYEMLLSLKIAISKKRNRGTVLPGWGERRGTTMGTAPNIFFCPDNLGESRSETLCDHVHTFFGNRCPKSSLVSVFGHSKSCQISCLKCVTPKISHQSNFKIDFEAGRQGVGHIKILKISKETPKDFPETLYGPYRHYGCGVTGCGRLGGRGTVKRLRP